MKTLAARSGWLVPILMAALVAGCVTPPINWPARVGNYTFDQAIQELGPPDKQARLQDGTIVAEWLTRRGYTHAYSSFGYYSPWYYGPYPAYIDTYWTPDYFLRLIFGPDDRLKSWKNFTR